MKRFFSPNIDGRGRLVRGITATAFLLSGVLVLRHVGWVGWLLLASGGFVAFEALRGWCFLRACGIKTKL